MALLLKDIVYFTNHLLFLHLAFLKCLTHLVQTHQHLLHETQSPEVKTTTQYINIINVFYSIIYTAYVCIHTNVGVAQPPQDTIPKRVLLTVWDQGSITNKQ